MRPGDRTHTRSNPRPCGAGSRPHPTLARPGTGDPTPRTRRATLGLLAAAAARLRLVRYEIAEDSMEPALHPGDWALGVRRPTTVAIGDIVVVEHPHRPGFRLVKRVVARTAAGLVIHGDHAGHSVDSRDFGPVPPDAVLALLVLVYHPGPRRRL